MDFKKTAWEYVCSVLPEHYTFEREKVFHDWVDKNYQSRFDNVTNRLGDLRDKHVLDIGHGNGKTLEVFAREGVRMSGLEVSEALHTITKDVLAAASLKADVQLYNGTSFPFSDNTFDHIYSISVLEHTDDPVAVLQEAARVLKPGGTFYLAFPNKLYPKETHNGLWFISYLPRRIADWVLKKSGRSGLDSYWNLHFISFCMLKRWITKNNIPLHIRYETDSSKTIMRIAKKVLAFFGLHYSMLLPHIMVVLEKEV